MHAATIRTTPDDFVVDELPAYEPSGSGEHLYLVIRKRDLTTLEAIKRIARALGSDDRGAGYAGMKDRHAVTTQALSFPFPIARGDGEAAAGRLEVPGVEVLSASRHSGKLKPGHLAGNRFRIVLRGLGAAERDEVKAALERIAVTGAPNAFGSQRFGRDGDNPERALAWLAGKERGPRDRREQRMLFSALQSLLFNRVLEQRVAAGTWTCVLPGDVAKKHDTGGIFTVPLEGAELDEARARAERGQVSATGPMFGVKMRWPEGEPAAIERAALTAAMGDVSRLEALKHLGEGTRRPLRLFASDLSAEATSDGLSVRFVLPKGGYATTVLGCACTLVDASRVAPPVAGEPAEEPEDSAR